MTPPTQGTSWALPIVSLWRRELVRFVRQRSRIVGALGTPIVFWVLIGSGLGSSFRLTGDGVAREMNYLEYSFPGTIVLIVLFTAIFSTISIIEDRREGFLQSVLAAPIERSAIVLGKVLGSATLAVGQAMLFVVVMAWAAGISLTVGAVIASLGILIILSIALSALGFLIAWPMDSTQGFHAIMNLFLVPMWLLSGAFFPASGASDWMGWVIRLNPLTYGVTALRRALYWGSQPDAAAGEMATAVVVTIGFAVVTVALAVRSVQRVE